MFKGWLFCLVCMDVVALVSSCFPSYRKCLDDDIEELNLRYPYIVVCPFPLR
jgi:hypothetical protein